MYLVRRTYKTKPGEARRVANLVQKQVQIYHDAGHREEFRVAYNDRTCPGEQNIVVLEWETAAFQSPAACKASISPKSNESIRQGAEWTPPKRFRVSWLMMR